jgi:hypothetical protein|tara:strand:- start:1886 stop:3325 length:1440 start_codon:yes stop_codon:yes gene_type:complete
MGGGVTMFLKERVRPRLRKTAAVRVAMGLWMLLFASGQSLNASERLLLAAPKVTLYANQGLVSGVVPEVSVQSDDVITVAIPETVTLDGVYVMPKTGNRVRQMQITPWLGSAQQTLQAYLGQSIEFLAPSPGNVGPTTYQPGVLKTGQPILVSTSKGLQTVAFDQLRFPDIGLTVSPNLALTIENAGPFSGHLAYIAPGLSWSANYEMVYDPKAREVRIQSSAALSNTTQLSIEDAEITVVAGQLSAAVRPRFQSEMSMPMRRSAAMDRGPAAVAAPAGLQYQWRLPQRVTLGAGRSLQVALEAPWVAPAKLVFRSRSSVQPYPSNAPQPQSVPAFLLITPQATGPSSDHPMASGLVRVFERSPTGQPMLMGEDQLTQTPSGAPFEVHLGRAFDVRLTRTTSDFRVINDRLHEVTLALLLENTGKTAATIELQEDFSGALSLLANTPNVIESIGQSVWVKLELAPQSKQLVTYTARVRY